VASEIVLELPAWRLAELIRRGELDALAVVDAHIARIEKVNPHLNALIDDRFTAARREAVAADHRRRAGGADLPPLLGVPCTIKEFIAVEGMSWTAGLWARRGRTAERDAPVVQRLRAAGAIVLGVSNVPEGGMWMETYNAVHGRTSNPWDVTRTPGGSSGGEAALVAAGASPLGLGSDIAGSIRIPAAMCGVIGHKPSERLVPNTGHWGEGGAEAGRMLCIGPIGRCVRDVELALEIVAGAGAHEGHHLPAPEHDDLRGVRVIPIRATGRVRIAPVMRAGVDRAAAALADRGATIVELDHATWRRLFGNSIGTWLRALSDSGDDTDFAALITEGAPLAIVPELVRIARGQPRHATATLALIALERLSSRLERFTHRGPPIAEIQAGLEEVLGDRGVIVHPPYSRPAPRHQWPLLTPFDAVCTALFSVTGLPATVVPVGFDDRHLPVAVQIVGRRGRDRLTLAVARAVEAALGGWTPAPA